MSVYARIILEQDMEWVGKHGNFLDGEVTEFTNLKQIERPIGNGEGREKERFYLEHPDGTVEEVVGYLVGSGLE